MAQTKDSHSHGVTPIQTRSERLKSFRVEDFPTLSPRDEAWRYLPFDRLGALATGKLQDFEKQQLEANGPAAAKIEWIPVDSSQSIGFAVPEDVVAAQIWGTVAEVLSIEIPNDTELSEPVVLGLRNGSGAFGLRVLVRIGENASGTVILDHRGAGQLGEFAEFELAAGSRLTIVSIQDGSKDSTHISTQFARLGRDSNLKHIVVSTGGSLVRVVPSVELSQPGAAVELYGVYLAESGDYIEHRPFVDHISANCSSRVSYKGALQGETAHTVWVADVLIRETAEGTDTYEVNRNLLLTDGARADSVPNLEIQTGKISGAGHASASGRFDDEQLFYLMSRGVGMADAKRLVVRGFLAEVILQIGEPSIQSRILDRVENELARIGDK